MAQTLGLACHWGPDRSRTWSGTPLALRAALGERVVVRDIDVSLPASQQLVFKAASARRSAGVWQAKWRHGRLATRAVERRLRAAVRATDADTVLEIGDLGTLERPFAVLQDLSYELLLSNFGAGGVPHFRSLTRAQLERLRARQLAVYSAAAHLLPMSRWLADRCVASGVAAERVTVVNPGVNAPLDLDLPVPERRRNDTRRLLFIGRDFETKAGDQVVAAFHRLRSEFGPAMTLTVAGPRTWPLATPPADGIRFLGPVPGDRVQELYDAHDLFVMPSRFEGFGIAFVEALVRGLPCIGRDACAMPEIITPGDGGLLINTDDPGELAEAIVLALDDDGLYARCAAAAPARREHYTWRRAASQVITALDLATA